MPASKGSLCSEPHGLLENQGSLDTYRSGASTKVNVLLFTVSMLRYALTLCRMRTCLGSLTIGGTSDISPVRTPGHAALRSPGSPSLPLGPWRLVQDSSAEPRHRGAGFAIRLHRGTRGMARRLKLLQLQEVLIAIGWRRP